MRVVVAAAVERMKKYAVALSEKKPPKPSDPEVPALPHGHHLDVECLHEVFKSIARTPAALGKWTSKSVQRLMSLKYRAEEALFLRGRESQTGAGVTHMLSDGSLFIQSMPEMLNLPFWGKASIT